MATISQIDANRANAQKSTGPKTETGKLNASRNHLTLGLYTRQDYVKPEERELYKEFCETMLLELAPATLLEQSLASEITGASWRLRRCSAAEAELADYALMDPLLDEDEATQKKLKSIERARASAHSLFHRSINQLRKLQTDRQSQIGFELSDTEITGIADSKKVHAAARKREREAATLEPDPRKEAEAAFDAALRAAIEPPDFIKEAIDQKLEEIRLRHVAEGLESEYELASNCELTEEERAAFRESEELANFSFEDLANLEELGALEDEAA
jgi:hypothetical protein